MWSDDRLLVNEVHRLLKGRQIDLAVDILLEQTDDLLLAGEFSRCDALLSMLDQELLGPHLWSAILAFTKHPTPI